MKNIIWADSEGNVKITVFAPDYIGTSQDHAKNITAGEGFQPVAYDFDTKGMGASDLKYISGEIVSNG